MSNNSSSNGTDLDEFVRRAVKIDVQKFDLESKEFVGNRTRFNYYLSDWTER